MITYQYPDDDFKPLWHVVIVWNSYYRDMDNYQRSRSGEPEVFSFERQDDLEAAIRNSFVYRLTRDIQNAKTYNRDNVDWDDFEIILAFGPDGILNIDILNHPTIKDLIQQRDHEELFYHLKEVGKYSNYGPDILKVINLDAARPDLKAIRDEWILKRDQKKLSDKRKRDLAEFVRLKKELGE